MTLLVIAGLGLAVAAFFLFRIPERVVVEKMVRFGEAQPDTERVITDREKVRTFAYAVRFARKQPGKADMAVPP
ncbi:hypothetical protein MJA45_23870 [Paenibacillus aurantius]|uniref:Uncharacterized protein n=1 Tax=Paenibacillus aurantius TaxID=2918900 RepID=A0AA96LEH6_9BACL|nr:hypothetical protein [Paenibacillus aurantius]WNQ10625.1 hypothetical protein MJA45_23870 [Paenibacillus aurantius]